MRPSRPGPCDRTARAGSESRSRRWRRCAEKSPSRGLRRRCGEMPLRAQCSKLERRFVRILGVLVVELRPVAVHAIPPFDRARLRVRGDDRLRDDQHAARCESAAREARQLDKTRRLQMVQKADARDQIELALFAGEEIVSVRDDEIDVRKAQALCCRARHVEHRVAVIDRDDARERSSEAAKHVARAGADVEHQPLFRRQVPQYRAEQRVDAGPARLDDDAVVLRRDDVVVADILFRMAG